MHPLVPAVLLPMPGLDALELNPEAQPPDGELTEAIERRRGGEGDAIIGANGRGEPKVFEGALEDGEREPFLRGRERLTREQVAAGEVGDGEGVAVPAIAEHELAFVVGAPQGIGV